MSKVLISADYDTFKLIEGNRPIMNGHVEKLIRSFQKYPAYELSPILVNERMEILDGQHRFAAFKKMQVPIHYRISTDQDYEGVTHLQVSARWGISDYLKFYASTRGGAYKAMQDLEEKYGMPKGSAFFLIGKRSGRQCEEFRRGNYNGRGLDEIEEILKHYSSLIDALISAEPELGKKTKGFYSRAMLTTFASLYKFLKLLPNFDHEWRRLLKNASRIPASIHFTRSEYGAKQIFQRIFNYGRRKSVAEISPLRSGFMLINRHDLASDTIGINMMEDELQ